MPCFKRGAGRWQVVAERLKGLSLERVGGFNLVDVHQSDRAETVAAHRQCHQEDLDR